MINLHTLHCTVSNTFYGKGREGNWFGVLSNMIPRTGTRQSKRNQITKFLYDANITNYNPALRILPGLRLWLL